MMMFYPYKYGSSALIALRCWKRGLFVFGFVSDFGLSSPFSGTGNSTPRVGFFLLTPKDSSNLLHL